MLDLVYVDLGCEVPAALNARISTLQSSRSAARARKGSAAYSKRRAQLAVNARKRGQKRKRLSSLKNFGYKRDKQLQWNAGQIKELEAELGAIETRIKSMKQVCNSGFTSLVTVVVLCVYLRTSFERRLQQEES